MSKINLIGINGYIGSGKDTVAKIIQILTSRSPIIQETKDEVGVKYLLDTYHKNIFPNNELDNFDWQIKKYAGKLKQIASILTGIPVEKFENQEFKKTFLGEEWNYETVCCTRVLEAWVENHKCSNCWEPATVQQMTIRELLQKLGTEAMRDGLHTNTWVNALFADYKKNCNNDLCPYHLGLCDGNNCSAIYPNWIISDLRFPNEFDAIKERGGICIRVNRPNINKLIDSGIDVQKHPSETSLDSHTFDYMLDNNGTVEDLVTEVEKMLKQFNIL